MLKRALYSQLKAQAKKDGKDAKTLVSFKDFKYASTDRLPLLLDRTVGNTMEQAIPFLTALWMHAAFVSVDSAALVGWIYVVTRAIYPVGFYLGLPWILLSTGPGYACIAYLLYTCVAGGN